MFDEAISLLSIWASMNSWLTPTVLFLLLNLMIGTIFVTSGVTSYKPHHQNHHETAVNHHQQQPPITRAPSVLQRLKSMNFYSYYSHTPSSSTTLTHQHVPTQVHVPEKKQNSSPVSDPFVRIPELRLPKVPARAPFKTETRTQAQTRVLDEEIIMPQTRTWTETRTQTQTLFLDEEIIIPPTRTQTLVPEADTTDDDGPTLDEIYSRIKGASSVHYNRQNSDTQPIGGEIPVKLPAKIKKSASDKSAFDHFHLIEEDENAAPHTEEKQNAAVATAVVATASASSNGSEVDARADDFINNFKKQLQLQKMESIVRYKEMISRGSGK